METFNKKNHTDKQFGLGILIVVIGAVFLLRNTGVDVPHWVLSWHTIMLGAGLWIGYRKNFQGSGWLALTIIGAIFTLRDITVFDFAVSKITTALVLISLGLYVILKPRKLKSFDQYYNKTSSDSSELKN